MANISAFGAALMLNFSLRGETTGIPTAWAIGLATGSPTPTAGSEIATGSGYARATGLFSTAVSPVTTSKNSASCTFGPFSNAQSISGLHIWNQVATGGSFMWQGLLATARTVGVGDSLVLAVDAATISLA